jgi:hypothetical protein
VRGLFETFEIAERGLGLGDQDAERGRTRSS